MSGYEYRTPEIERKIRRELAVEKRAKQEKCWMCRKRKKLAGSSFCSQQCEYEYNKIGY